MVEPWLFFSLVIAALARGSFGTTPSDCNGGSQQLVRSCAEVGIANGEAAGNSPEVVDKPLTRKNRRSVQLDSHGQVLEQVLQANTKQPQTLNHQFVRIAKHTQASINENSVKKKLTLMQQDLGNADAKMSDQDPPYENTKEEALKIALKARALWKVQDRVSRGTHGDDLQPSLEVTHYFKPGRLGISYDDNGLVEEVSNNGPAHTKGIKEGSRIVQVDGKKYSKGSLLEAESSGKQYRVTFEVSRHEAWQTSALDEAVDPKNPDPSLPVDLCKVRGTKANNLTSLYQTHFMKYVAEKDVGSGMSNWESSCFQPEALHPEPQFSKLRIAADQTKAASEAQLFRDKEWSSTAWATNHFGKVYRGYIVSGSWPRQWPTSQTAFDAWTWSRAIPGRGLLWIRLNTTHFETFWGRDPAKPRLYNVWRIDYYDGRPDLQDVVLVKSSTADARTIESPIEIGYRIHQRVLFDSTRKFPAQLIEYFTECFPEPCIHRYEVGELYTADIGVGPYLGEGVKSATNQ